MLVIPVFSWPESSLHSILSEKITITLVLITSQCHLGIQLKGFTGSNNLDGCPIYAFT